jgi:SMC interacting uncharacterized protein involved in chromosome segregation
MENAETISTKDIEKEKIETSKKELNLKIKTKFSDPDKLSQQHNTKLKSIIEEVRHSLDIDSN